MATQLHSFFVQHNHRRFQGAAYMGTVGLSFGSATSGAGFDVTSTVSQILALQQGVETPWKNRLSALTAQDAALSTLGSDLAGVSSALQSLTAFDGVMYGKEGSSSNTNVLALSSATPTASAGSHSVVVSQLAETASVYSDAFAATDTLSGSLTIQVGSAAAQPIAITSSNDTLASLATSINTANIGVTASVISDSSGSRLSLVSNTSGSAGALTVSSSLSDATTSTAIATHTGQAGQDANFTVDGLALTSSSNVVSTAIPGVTFQLLSTSTAPVQVSIANNTAAISAAFSNLTSAYNQLINDMKKQEGKDASGKAEPLFGSPTLALLQNALSAAMIGGAPSGSISSATQLGLSLNQDGTLSFSDSTLQTALNTNFADVLGYMENTGSFGQNLSSVLNGLSASNSSGALALAEQQNSTEEASLNQNISDEEDRLAGQKTSLTAELNRANQIMQAIPSQLNEINEMYSAITGYKG